ncbi:MAG: hypothetical protein QM755_09260 [Luteolibacter sp.]
MSATTTPQISKEARLAVLEEELETVRWMTSTAKDDERRAAANLRVLELKEQIAREQAA